MQIFPKNKKCVSAQLTTLWQPLAEKQNAIVLEVKIQNGLRHQESNQSLP